MLSLLTLLALAVLTPSPAEACGGPDSRELDLPLQPVSARANVWLDPWDGEADNPEPVTRFLYAFRAANPDLYAALDGANTMGAMDHVGAAESVVPPAAGSFPEQVMPATDHFHAALAKGDYNAANTAAVAMVKAILDLPATLAEPYGEQLRLAVEFIEVRPTLTGVPADAVAAWFANTHASAIGLPVPLAAVAAVRSTAMQAAKPDRASPRAASLRWLAIRQALKVGVPDGWSADDIATAAAKTGDPGFSSLQSQLDGWLRDYPDHPLADLARLKKVRLYYLAKDPDNAWKLLIAMYPRHPARVANELRFLTMQGSIPANLPVGTPPEALVGLLDSHPLDANQWTTLWGRAQAAKGQPWALPVEEKLLLQLVDGPADDPLPAAFPAVAAAPSQTWAKLRLLVLAARPALSTSADFAAQLALIDAKDPLLPPIIAHVALARHDWVGAIRTPGLAPASVQYLIRVLAPEDELKKLADDPDKTIRWEVRLSLASRQLSRNGDWNAGAAMLEPVDPARAVLWRDAGKLAASNDPKQVLAYARFLRANGGMIFVGNGYEDVVWYRSLPVSGPPEPGAIYNHAGVTPTDEWAATDAWLKRSFSTYYALGAYARWLDLLPPGHPRGSALTDDYKVLAEADTTYNLLLNYGSGDYYAWARALPGSQPAKDVRRVGRVIRAK